jgi:hypothetical protein
VEPGEQGSEVGGIGNQRGGLGHPRIVASARRPGIPFASGGGAP